MLAKKDVSLAPYYVDLPDPRVMRTQKHSLLNILTIALCAVIGGCDSFDEIEDFGNERLEWFKSFLELTNGIPSHDNFNRFFGGLNPKCFNECVGRWMEAVSEATGLRHIAIDGKSVKASTQKTFTGCLHLVSAWASEQGVILGQEAVAEKSNEISAIPELLRVLHQKGAIVTIDAAGCQKEIAQQIRDAGGHYLLAVKGNQPSLDEAVRRQFEEACASDFAGIAHSHHATSEKGHGREEERDVTVIATPTGPTGLPEGWADVAAIVMVGRERTVGGVTTATTHFYVTSLNDSAEKLGGLIRKHWSVENQLRWSLDVTFREDSNRTREKHAGENLGLIRRFALSLIKQDPGKGALKGKRKRAGWNLDYLAKIISGFQAI